MWSSFKQLMQWHEVARFRDLNAREAELGHKK